MESIPSAMPAAAALVPSPPITVLSADWSACTVTARAAVHWHALEHVPTAAAAIPALLKSHNLQLLSPPALPPSDSGSAATTPAAATAGTAPCAGVTYDNDGNITKKPSAGGTAAASAPTAAAAAATAAAAAPRRASVPAIALPAIDASGGIRFLYTAYRAVFVLDAGPSIATLCPLTGRVLFSALFDAVRVALTHLALTTAATAAPELFVSIFAADASSTPVRVLLQNTRVSVANLSRVLQTIAHRIHELQHAVARSHTRAAREKREIEQNRLSSMAVTGGLFGADHNRALSEKKQGKRERLAGATALASIAGSTAAVAAPNNNGKTSKDLRREARREARREREAAAARRRGERTPAAAAASKARRADRAAAGAGASVSGAADSNSASASVDLRSLLLNGLFAIERCAPAHACPLLFLVTDGVLGLSDAHAYDSLLTQFTRRDVTCNILHVATAAASSPHAFIPSVSFGYIPDNELLQFVARRTGGVYCSYTDMLALARESDTALMVSPASLPDATASGDEKAAPASAPAALAPVATHEPALISAAATRFQLALLSRYSPLCDLSTSPSTPAAFALVAPPPAATPPPIVASAASGGLLTGLALLSTGLHLSNSPPTTLTPNAAAALVGTQLLTAPLSSLLIGGGSGGSDSTALVGASGASAARSLFARRGSSSDLFGSASSVVVASSASAHAPVRQLIRSLRSSGAAAVSTPQFAPSAPPATGGGGGGEGSMSPLLSPSMGAALSPSMMGAGAGMGSVLPLLLPGATSSTVGGYGLSHPHQSMDDAYPWDGVPPPVPLWRERIKHYSLRVGVTQLIESRVGEGFKHARITRTPIAPAAAAGVGIVSTVAGTPASAPVTTPSLPQQQRVSITLSFEWQSSIGVEYVMSFVADTTATAAASTQPTVIEVDIHAVAAYEFLSRLNRYQNEFVVGRPAGMTSSNSAGDLKAGGGGGGGKLARAPPQVAALAVVDLALSSSARLYAFMTEIENTDIVSHHLARVVLTDAELAACARGGTAVRLPQSNPQSHARKSSKSASAAAAVGSSASYLSASHYLWSTLFAAYPPSVWRRWCTAVDTIDLPCAFASLSADGDAAALDTDDTPNSRLDAAYWSLTPALPPPPPLTSRHFFVRAHALHASIASSFASVAVNANLFVKFITPSDSSPTPIAASVPADAPTSTLHRVPICLVRIAFHSSYLALINIGFVGVTTAAQRAATTSALRAAIANFGVSACALLPPPIAAAPQLAAAFTPAAPTATSGALPPPSIVAAAPPTAVGGAAGAAPAAVTSVAGSSGAAPASTALIATATVVPALSDSDRSVCYPFVFADKSLASALLNTLPPALHHSHHPSSSTTSLSSLVAGSDFDAARTRALRLLRGYMRHQQWTWKINPTPPAVPPPATGSRQAAAPAPAPVQQSSIGGVMRALRAVRQEEGFILASAPSAHSFTVFREVPIAVGGGSGTASQVVACVLQYSVTQVSAEHIQTELWMEPHDGVYHCGTAHPFFAASGPAAGSGGTSYVLDSQTVFDTVASFVHACDLHVTSAVVTFDSISQLIRSHHATSAAAAALAAANARLQSVNGGGQPPQLNRPHSSSGIPSGSGHSSSAFRAFQSGLNFAASLSAGAGAAAPHVAESATALQLRYDFHAFTRYEYGYDSAQRCRMYAPGPTPSAVAAASAGASTHAFAVASDRRAAAAGFGIRHSASGSGSGSGSSSGSSSHNSSAKQFNFPHPHTATAHSSNLSLADFKQQNPAQSTISPPISHNAMLSPRANAGAASHQPSILLSPRHGPTTVKSVTVLHHSGSSETVLPSKALSGAGTAATTGGGSMRSSSRTLRASSSRRRGKDGSGSGNAVNSASANAAAGATSGNAGGATSTSHRAEKRRFHVPLSVSYLLENALFAVPVFLDVPEIVAPAPGAGGAMESNEAARASVNLLYAQRSHDRMHDMLLHAIRRIADIELIDERCFAVHVPASAPNDAVADDSSFLVIVLPRKGDYSTVTPPAPAPAATPLSPVHGAAASTSTASLQHRHRKGSTGRSTYDRGSSGGVNASGGDAASHAAAAEERLEQMEDDTELALDDLLYTSLDRSAHAFNSCAAQFTALSAFASALRVAASSAPANGAAAAADEKQPPLAAADGNPTLPAMITSAAPETPHIRIGVYTVSRDAVAHHPRSHNVDPASLPAHILKSAAPASVPAAAVASSSSSRLPALPLVSLTDGRKRPRTGTGTVWANADRDVQRQLNEYAAALSQPAATPPPPPPPPASSTVPIAPLAPGAEPVLVRPNLTSRERAIARAEADDLFTLVVCNHVFAQFPLVWSPPAATASASQSPQPQWLSYVSYTYRRLIDRDILSRIRWWTLNSSSSLGALSALPAPASTGATVASHAPQLLALHNSLSRLQDRVHDWQERAFVRGVYTNLVEGIPVSPLHVWVALSCCAEYVCEVDVTGVQQHKQQQTVAQPPQLQRPGTASTALPSLDTKQVLEAPIATPTPAVAVAATSAATPLGGGGRGALPPTVDVITPASMRPALGAIPSIDIKALDPSGTPRASAGGAAAVGSARTTGGALGSARVTAATPSATAAAAAAAVGAASTPDSLTASLQSLIESNSTPAIVARIQRRFHALVAARFQRCNSSTDASLQDDALYFYTPNKAPAAAGGASMSVDGGASIAGVSASKWQEKYADFSGAAPSAPSSAAHPPLPFFFRMECRVQQKEETAKPAAVPAAAGSGGLKSAMKKSPPLNAAAPTIPAATDNARALSISVEPAAAAAATTASPATGALNAGDSVPTTPLPQQQINGQPLTPSPHKLGRAAVGSGKATPVTPAAPAITTTILPVNHSTSIGELACMSGAALVGPCSARKGKAAVPASIAASLASATSSFSSSTFGTNTLTVNERSIGAGGTVVIPPLASANSNSGNALSGLVSPVLGSSAVTVPPSPSPLSPAPPSTAGSTRPFTPKLRSASGHTTVFHPRASTAPLRELSTYLRLIVITLPPFDDRSTADSSAGAETAGRSRASSTATSAPPDSPARSGSKPSAATAASKRSSATVYVPGSKSSPRKGAAGAATALTSLFRGPLHAVRDGDDDDDDAGDAAAEEKKAGSDDEKKAAATSDDDRTPQSGTAAPPHASDEEKRNDESDADTPSTAEVDSAREQPETAEVDGDSADSDDSSPDHSDAARRANGSRLRTGVVVPSTSRPLGSRMRTPRASLVSLFSPYHPAHRLLNVNASASGSTLDSTATLTFGSSIQSTPSSTISIASAPAMARFAKRYAAAAVAAAANTRRDSARSVLVRDAAGELVAPRYLFPARKLAEPLRVLLTELQQQLNALVSEELLQSMLLSCGGGAMDALTIIAVRRHMSNLPPSAVTALTIPLAFVPLPSASTPTAAVAASGFGSGMSAAAMASLAAEQKLQTEHLERARQWFAAELRRTEMLECVELPATVTADGLPQRETVYVLKRLGPIPDVVRPRAAVAPAVAKPAATVTAAGATGAAPKKVTVKSKPTATTKIATATKPIAAVVASKPGELKKQVSDGEEDDDDGEDEDEDEESGEDEDEDEEEEDESDSDESDDGTNAKRAAGTALPFWLLLTVRAGTAGAPADGVSGAGGSGGGAGYLEVQFHRTRVPEKDQTRLLAHLRTAISNICLRVNQLCLLSHVHDTRVVSPLLMAPGDDVASEAAAQAAAAAAAEGKSAAPATVSSAAGSSAFTFGMNSAASQQPPQSQRRNAEMIADGSIAGFGADASGEQSYWTAGQLKPPHLLTLSVTLHERLKPDVALTQVAHRAFEPFATANRPNLYVYREQQPASGAMGVAEGSGVVCLIRIGCRPVRNVAPPPQPSASDSAPAARAVPNAAAASPSAASAAASAAGSFDTASLDGGGNQQTRASAVSISSRTRPSAAVAASSSKPDTKESGVVQQYELVYDVFGVEMPGDAVRVQLFQVLCARLQAHTLLTVSTYLHKLPTLKLTPGDHLFIRPAYLPAPVTAAPAAANTPAAPCVTATGLPAKTLGFSLPAWIADPYLFLLYLRQHLIGFTTPMNFVVSQEKGAAATAGDKERAAREALREALREVNSNASASVAAAGGEQKKLVSSYNAHLTAAFAATPVAAGPTPPRVEWRNDEWSFLFNNAMSTQSDRNAGVSSAPPTASAGAAVPISTPLRRALGKGMAALYVSLVDPNGVGPITSLQTWSREPWRVAQTSAAAAAATTPSSLIVPAMHLPAVSGGPVSQPFAAAAAGYRHYQYHHSTGGVSLRRVITPPESKSDAKDASAPATAAAAGWFVVIEVWSVGTIAHDVLCSKLTLDINQSIHEYATECMLHAWRYRMTPLPQPLPVVAAAAVVPAGAGSSTPRMSPPAAASTPREKLLAPVEAQFVSSATTPSRSIPPSAAPTTNAGASVSSSLISSTSTGTTATAGTVATTATTSTDGAGTPSNSSLRLSNIPDSPLHASVSSVGPPATGTPLAASASAAPATVPAAVAASIPPPLSPQVLSQLQSSLLEPATALLLHGVSLTSPLVHRIAIRLAANTLHAWCVPRLIHEIQSVIKTLNPGIVPLAVGSTPKAGRGRKVVLKPAGATFKRTYAPATGSGASGVVFAPYDTTTAVGSRVSLTNSATPETIVVLGGFGLGAERPPPPAIEDTKTESSAHHHHRGRTLSSSVDPAAVNEPEVEPVRTSRRVRSTAAAAAAVAAAGGDPSGSGSVSGIKSKQTRNYSSTAQGRFSEPANMVHPHVDFEFIVPPNAAATISGVVLPPAASTSLAASASAASFDTVSLDGGAAPAAVITERGTMHRHCVALVTLSSHASSTPANARYALTLWTYNWRVGAVEQLTRAVSRLCSWNAFRIQLLHNIVTQKLGLFHHSSDRAPRAPPIVHNYEQITISAPAHASGAAHSGSGVHKSALVLSTPAAAPAPATATASGLLSPRRGSSATGAAVDVAVASKRSRSVPGARRRGRANSNRAAAEAAMPEVEARYRIEHIDLLIANAVPPTPLVIAPVRGVQPPRAKSAAPPSAASVRSTPPAAVTATPAPSTAASASGNSGVLPPRSPHSTSSTALSGLAGPTLPAAASSAATTPPSTVRTAAATTSGSSSPSSTAAAAAPPSSSSSSPSAAAAAAAQQKQRDMADRARMMRRFNVGGGGPPPMGGSSSRGPSSRTSRPMMMMSSPAKPQPQPQPAPAPVPAATDAASKESTTGTAPAPATASTSATATAVGGAAPASPRTIASAPSTAAVAAVSGSAAPTATASTAAPPASTLLTSPKPTSAPTATAGVVASPTPAVPVAPAIVAPPVPTASSIVAALRLTPKFVGITSAAAAVSEAGAAAKKRIPFGQLMRGVARERVFEHGLSGEFGSLLVPVWQSVGLDPVAWHARSLQLLLAEVARRRQLEKDESDIAALFHHLCVLSTSASGSPSASITLPLLWHVSRSSRIIDMRRAPILFNESAAARYAAPASHVVPAGGSGSGVGIGGGVIAMQGALSSLSCSRHARHETNRYLTIMESLLRQYVRYLTRCLESHVLAIDDGAEEHKRNAAAAAGGSASNKRHHSGHAHIVIEDIPDHPPKPVRAVSNGGRTPRRTVTIALNPVRVFVQKALGSTGFTLLFQVYFHDMFACCDVYVTGLPQRPPPSKKQPSLFAESAAASNDVKGLTSAAATTAGSTASAGAPPPIDSCRDERLNYDVLRALSSGVTERLHLNSFSYDFHVRHVAAFLLGTPLAAVPGAAPNSGPGVITEYPTFQLFDMIDSFTRYYPSGPPPFARNHVVSGAVSIKLHAQLNDTTSFVEYVASHGKERYGLGNLLHRASHTGSAAGGFTVTGNGLQALTIFSGSNPSASATGAAPANPQRFADTELPVMSVPNAWHDTASESASVVAATAAAKHGSKHRSQSKDAPPAASGARSPSPFVYLFVAYVPPPPPPQPETPTPAPAATESKGDSKTGDAKSEPASAPTPAAGASSSIQSDWVVVGDSKQPTAPAPAPSQLDTKAEVKSAPPTRPQAGGPPQQRTRPATRGATASSFSNVLTLKYFVIRVDRENFYPLTRAHPQPAHTQRTTHAHGSSSAAVNPQSSPTAGVSALSSPPVQPLPTPSPPAAASAGSGVPQPTQFLLPATSETAGPPTMTHITTKPGVRRLGFAASGGLDVKASAHGSTATGGAATPATSSPAYGPAKPIAATAESSASVLPSFWHQLSNVLNHAVIPTAQRYLSEKLNRAVVDFERDELWKKITAPLPEPATIAAANAAATNTTGSLPPPGMVLNIPTSAATILAATAAVPSTAAVPPTAAAVTAATTSVAAASTGGAGAAGPPSASRSAFLTAAVVAAGGTLPAATSGSSGAPATAAGGAVGAGGELFSLTSNGGTGSVGQLQLTEHEFALFHTLFVRTPLSVIDSSLGDVWSASFARLGGSVWRSLFAFLLRVYTPKRVRHFAVHEQKHLLILMDQSTAPPAAAAGGDRDMFLHVAIEAATDRAKSTVLTYNHLSSAAATNQLNGSAFVATHVPTTATALSAALSAQSQRELSGMFGVGEMDIKWSLVRRTLTAASQLNSKEQQHLITHFINSVCHFCWNYQQQITNTGL